MLFEKRMYRFIKIFAYLFIIGVFPASAAIDEGKEQFRSIVREIEQIQEMQRTKTAQHIKSLYDIAYEHPDSLRLLPECFYREAYTNYLQSCYDSLLFSRGEAVSAMLNTSLYPLEHALLLLGFGFYNTTKGDYAEAFTSALQALERFTQLNEPGFTKQTLILLGDICTFIRSYKMAEDYFSQVIRVSPPFSSEYYQAVSGLTKIYFMTGEAERAIDMFLEMIPICEQQQDTAHLASAYLRLGSCYHLNEEPEKTLECYNATLNLIERMDNTRILFSLYQNIATYHAAYSNDFTSAIHYYRLAKGMATYNNNNLEQLSYVYYGLAVTYEKTGDADSAYFYLRKSDFLKDQLFNNSKTIEAYRGHVSAMLESSRKELKIAEQEIIIKNKRFVFVVVLAIGATLIVVLLLIIMRQKKRAMSKQIEQNKEIQLLQEEKIALQTRELTSHALLLSGKGDLLKQINSLTKKLPSSCNEIKEIKEIKQILRSNLTTDRAWSSFMLHFDKVHPSFFEKLKAYNSELTANNLRFCAYFRIGLSTKEIAQIFNTTTGAIKRSRNRLKNKLNLNEEDSLDDFLRNI